MTDPRLFRYIHGYQATFRLETNGTWSVILDVFYDGEPWSIDDRITYHHLSLAECTDVLLEELSAARL